MTDKKRIIVVIPALNEEKNVGPVIEKIKKVVQDAYVLVINDGSTDLTREKALSFGAQVISFPFTMGIGAAMQAGFIFAQENNFDIAIQVDGDGQHNPEEIPLLLQPITEGRADVVIGSRYIEKKGDISSFQRRIGIKIFALLISKILGQRVTDSTSGFRAMNQRAISLCSKIYPEDYPEPESLVIFHFNRFSITEVAVGMEKRTSGVSSIGTFGSIYYMIKVTLAILIDLCKGKNLEAKGGKSVQS